MSRSASVQGIGNDAPIYSERVNTLKQRDNWHLTDLLRNVTGRGDPFAAAVRATRMPMVITDPRQTDNPIVFVNEAFQRLSGYDRDEIIGRNCRFLQGPETDQVDVARVRRAIENADSIDVDLLNYRKDGSTFWNALFLSPVHDDEGSVLFYFASQMDVTDRIEAQKAISAQKALVDREVKRRTQELQSALDAKTLLLHEVDHRVKNNLNMISSLLRLEARALDEPVLAAKLNTMLERLEALGSVHRKLYQGADVTRFDVTDFLSSIIHDLFGVSGRSNITVSTDLNPIHVDSARASALGLVLNEVLTNAIKHAFADGRGGKLSIKSNAFDSSAEIEIADDGPGIEIDRAQRKGLGYTLVTRLAKQADITVKFKSMSPGTTVVLSFPIRS